jgi:ATP-dependent Clp protease ATP-binding subunit ClpA
MFAPEFRNRLDAVIGFDHLPVDVVARVVDKFILQLELQLADRHVHIALTDEAKAWLTTRGYDRQMGARPMARLIQEEIKKPLADELLFGKLLHGGEVRVQLKDDKLAFEIIPGNHKPTDAGQTPKPKRKKSKPAEAA